jgi:hypothetical protein
VRQRPRDSVESQVRLQNLMFLRAKDYRSGKTVHVAACGRLAAEFARIRIHALLLPSCPTHDPASCSTVIAPQRWCHGLSGPLAPISKSWPQTASLAPIDLCRHPSFRYDKPSQTHLGVTPVAPWPLSISTLAPNTISVFCSVNCSPRARQVGRRFGENLRRLGSRSETEHSLRSLRPRPRPGRSWPGVV